MNDNDPITRTIDYSGLTSVVTTEDKRLYLSDGHKKPVDAWRYVSIVFFVIGGFCLLGLLFLIVASIAIIASSVESPNLIYGIVLSIVSTGFFVGVGWLFLIFGKRVADKKLRAAIRMQRFTQANGWSYAELTPDPTHNGILFQQGHSRYASNQVYSTSGRLFEIGNYMYVTGSGKNRTTHTWGYVCVELDRNVPNMVLDASANNTHLFGLKYSNLPAQFKKDQILSLEGDFNNLFYIVCSKRIRV